MVVSDAIVRCLCQFDNSRWIALPFVGVAGGVLLIWDVDLVEAKTAWVDIFSVIVVAVFKDESQKWMITGVYGPSLGGRLLDDFILELEVIRGRWDIPWCNGGDFNEILFLDKRNKATRRIRGMDVSGDFVDQNELIDVPLLGARFTWSNFQESPSLSKLDRFLVSTDWDDHFAPSMCECPTSPRPRPRAPFAEEGESPKPVGPFPFKFQNMWLLHLGFVELVKGWWEELEVWGPPGQRFKLKLKGIQDKLWVWNREVFGDIHKQKSACLEDIQIWDSVEEGLELDEE